MGGDSDSNGDTEEDTRESGVEFGDLEEKLSGHEYPTTRDEVVDAYGDHELEFENGSETLREVLGPVGDEGDTQEYESADEVHQEIFNMVGAEAVGRRYYSDRGGQPMGDDPDEEVEQDESF
jgi:hypothetical protein